MFLGEVADPGPPLLPCKIYFFIILLCTFYTATDMHFYQLSFVMTPYTAQKYITIPQFFFPQLQKVPTPPTLPTFEVLKQFTSGKPNCHVWHITHYTSF